jgi:hypothetical protein
VKWSAGVSYYDWDISPDGGNIAYLDYVTGPRHVGLISINHNRTIPSSFEVATDNPLRTLMWDADGKGFYISTYDNNSGNMKLLHTLLNGRISTLLHEPSGNDGWAIPSPDAKHLAIQKFTHNSNVWLLNRTSR